MFNMFWNLCRDEEGQDIAEYAVMLAVILVLVVGTIRLVGSNANNVFVGREFDQLKVEADNRTAR